jgi:uncharacterized protein YjiS (DUF1127 family)
MQTMPGNLAQSRDQPMGIGSCLVDLAQRSAQTLQRLWRAYWQCRTRRAAVLTLQALDDRTLDDLGLSRSEIVPAVYGSDQRPPLIALSFQARD